EERRIVRDGYSAEVTCHTKSSRGLRGLHGLSLLNPCNPRNPRLIEFSSGQTGRLRRAFGRSVHNGQREDQGSANSPYGGGREDGLSGVTAAGHIGAHFMNHLLVYRST